MRLNHPQRQQGTVLLIALMFLIAILAISVTAARNSALELRISGNMQNNFVQFQQAEAGAYATLALRETDDDPFKGRNSNNVFANINANANPLRDLPNSASIKVDTIMTSAATDCPRAATGFSAGFLACDHYRIDSINSSNEHQKSVHIGVIRTIAGKPLL